MFKSLHHVLLKKAIRERFVLTVFVQSHFVYAGTMRRGLEVVDGHLFSLNLLFCNSAPHTRQYVLAVRLDDERAIAVGCRLYEEVAEG